MGLTPTSNHAARRTVTCAASLRADSISSLPRRRACLGRESTRQSVPQVRFLSHSFVDMSWTDRSGKTEADLYTKNSHIRTNRRIILICRVVGDRPQTLYSAEQNRTRPDANYNCVGLRSLQRLHVKRMEMLRHVADSRMTDRGGFEAQWWCSCTPSPMALSRLSDLWLTRRQYPETVVYDADLIIPVGFIIYKKP